MRPGRHADRGTANAGETPGGAARRVEKDDVGNRTSPSPHTGVSSARRAELFYASMRAAMRR